MAGGDASETTAFLARTSGLDATHVNAYKALINGLVADGVFSKHDAIYMHATADTTTALLSLVSATYNGIAVNTPVFTADQGYTGAVNEAINSQFQLDTASSPKMTQNDATAWVWSNTSAAIDSGAVAYASGASSNFYVYPRGADDKAYANMFSNSGSGASFAVSDGKGLTAGTRTSSSTVILYKDGSALTTNSSTTSAAPASTTLGALIGDGIPYTGIVMAWGFGSQLNATDHANLYARLHTYLQTIAGIA